MTKFLRLILVLLGLVIGWSAIQHWLGAADLVDHYREVGLGEAGRLAVASLQSAACLGLLVRKTQMIAAFTLAAIMFAIAILHIVNGELLKVTLPFLLALLAALPAGALLGLQRRSSLDIPNSSSGNAT